MAKDLHRRRVAAVRRAIDSDPRLIEVWPAPQRLDALGHVIHLSHTEMHIECIRRAFAQPRHAAVADGHDEESVLAICRRTRETLSGDAALKHRAAVNGHQCRILLCRIEVRRKTNLSEQSRLTIRSE